MKTQYSIAWEKFKESQEFKRLLKLLNDKGIESPYADNIIRTAFDAGWNMPKL